MNYALLVYRCNGEYLYCAEEYETCAEVEERIQELITECDDSLIYKVYGSPFAVRITPPTPARVSVY